jgi:predicted nucleic acid-binding protein
VIDDTEVIIAFERGRLDIDALLGADDAAIASITAMELLVGVERADEAHRRRRVLPVEAVPASVPIVDYILAVARIHARLAVQAMSFREPRSAYDRIVAATVVADGRTLLTRYWRDSTSRWSARSDAGHGRHGPLPECHRTQMRPASAACLYGDQRTTCEHAAMVTAKTGARVRELRAEGLTPMITGQQWIFVSPTNPVVVTAAPTARVLRRKSR